MSEVSIRMAQGIGDIPAGEWSALLDQSDPSGNPFLQHAFLQALETSHSVGQDTGWLPLPVMAEDEAGKLLGAAPLYLKGHSMGEYVFDHAWANAYEQAGGQYYPKLQCAVPFTPANGPRLLAKDAAIKAGLISAMEEACMRFGASSVHATFVQKDDAKAFRKAGWLERHDMQFHFDAAPFANFDEFLASLKSSKRKAIRKERRKAQENIEIMHLSGADLKPEHWDAFFAFYQDTGARKWGRPYLTRDFFERMHADMADAVLLIMARKNGDWIAGALNFIGADTLYGRHWGCVEWQDSLHFELCYYQAMEAAFTRGLLTVEAGAQGAHKLARGYLPVITRSFHWFNDPGMMRAVGGFLQDERKAVAMEHEQLLAHTPYARVQKQPLTRSQLPGARQPSGQSVC